MKAKRALLTVLLAAGLVGCGRQQTPRHIVILPDVSGSIDREAEQQAFKAIDELASRLRRGDRLTIIPILGDAQAEASGRIIRFEVPLNRQTYDSDLRSFRAKLKASLDEMRTAAIARPGTKTDILGSIALAEQEFQSATGQSKRLLVVLSDFIQEDREIDFTKDKRLADRITAREFAIRTAKRDSINFKGIAIYLGLLRSNEYTKMGRKRREAIQEFWVEYVKYTGAQPRFVSDGPGLMTDMTDKSQLRAPGVANATRTF